MIENVTLDGVMQAPARADETRATASPAAVLDGIRRDLDAEERFLKARRDALPTLRPSPPRAPR